MIYNVIQVPKEDLEAGRQGDLELSIPHPIPGTCVNQGHVP